MLIGPTDALTPENVGRERITSTVVEGNFDATVCNTECTTCNALDVYVCACDQTPPMLLLDRASHVTFAHDKTIEKEDPGCRQSRGM